MARLEVTEYAPQARPARGLAFFALVLLAIAGLGHRFQAIDTPTFLWVMAIVGAVGLLALLLAFAAMRRIWIEDDEGTGSAIGGALLALIVLTPFAMALYGLLAFPSVSDVATDLADPPLLAMAAERREGWMNRVGPISPANAALIQREYPQLATRIYAVPAVDMVQAVLRVADARGLEVVHRGPTGDAGETTVELTGYSAALGFASDVAIRLRSDRATTIVDMRSASRFGGNDMGENAKRIANFLAALDYEIDVMTGVIVEE